MIKFSNILKQSNIFQTIKSDFEKSQLTHAYLLLSEDVVAMKLLARLIAQLILCEQTESPCEKCSVCERIEKGIYSDALEFGKETAINVEDINYIVESVIVRPFESEKKVYILYNIDQMNDVASNKFLKTLEEPPESTIFILTASSEFALLPTIVSRVKKISLINFPSNPICDELIKLGVDQKLAEVCAESCAGNIGIAEGLADKKGYLELYKRVLSLFKDMKGSKDVLLKAKLFGKDKAEFNTLLDLTMSQARDMLLIKCGNLELVTNRYIMEQLRDVSENYSINALEKIMSKIIELKEKYFYGVNVISMIDELLLYIVEVRVTC